MGRHVHVHRAKDGLVRDVGRFGGVVGVTFERSRAWVAKDYVRHQFNGTLGRALLVHTSTLRRVTRTLRRRTTSRRIKRQDSALTMLRQLVR